jgi:hypothetical protein
MSGTADTVEVTGREAAIAFARDGYVVLPALIGPDLVDFCWSYANTKFASRLMQQAHGLDPAMHRSYADPAFDGLLEFLRPRIEAASGKRLHPTYSYYRMYHRGDVLEPHTDRPACEISVSLHIGSVSGAPWPLNIEGPAGAFAATLGPGDALLYRGMELRHWRDAFEGQQYVQVFLHYVDADGPHAARKFDGRPSLMAHKPAVARKRGALRSNLSAT